MGARRLGASGSEKDNVWLGRSYGAFSKSFKLPDVVDADLLTAHLENGVLTVTVPRRPKPEARRIPIRTGKRSAEQQQLGGGAPPEVEPASKE